MPLLLGSACRGLSGSWFGLPSRSRRGTLHFRHSTGAGDGLNIVVDRRCRRRPREPGFTRARTPRRPRARDPPTRSKRRSQCGPRRGHSHFYMSITALSRCLSPYLTAFDVDYLVCRCIAVRQHDAGRVLMRCLPRCPRSHAPNSESVSSAYIDIELSRTADNRFIHNQIFYWFSFSFFPGWTTSFLFFLLRCLIYIYLVFSAKDLTRRN